MHIKSLFGTNINKKYGIPPNFLHIFFFSTDLGGKDKKGTQPFAASPYASLKSVRG